MSNLHFETVSAKQLELLEKLGNLNLGKLLGGTALSLQIGHRKSYDLDFVTQEKIGADLVKKVQQVLKNFDLSQRLLSESQYTAFADEVKITFFQDEAPLLHNPQDFENFSLVNIKDIFSSKLYVIGRRATWRDYVDVAICLEQSVCSLKEAVEESVARYQINQRWILDPLTFFDDLEMTPIEWVGKEYSDSQIKDIIIKNVKEYLQNRLSKK
ncbi:MAG: nucleotidyl transferase AbiEii/AbiGii toxin family protein [Patescibacteria group bacterium]